MKVSAPRLYLLAIVCAFFSPAPFASGADDAAADFKGAWEFVKEGPLSRPERVIFRRSRMIVISEGKTRVGRLSHKKGDEYVFLAGFEDGEPDEGAEEIKLHLEGDALTMSGEGGTRTYSKMEFRVKFPRAKRKGFSYEIPDGWVSNVGLFARSIAREPESYDTDQLVHFYEAGVAKPTESVTLRLLDTPLEKVMDDLSEKLKNPALSWRKEELSTGRLKGVVFENSTDLGPSRVFARVYMLEWSEGKTIVLAAPTLLPYFPFDLDRDCRAILSSLE